ncbi:MAG: pyridoxal phosphate-dependent aminotransferase [Betaproteobacteria bacterium]|nr:pyridoxal phosphate-dependent aminotransferase [Betaproteobacteria bacterium]
MNAPVSPRGFDVRNRHFDTLFNTPGLMWLGQNTNHFATAPEVRQAMLDSIASEEYHAYAPPAGMQALREGILADVGLPDQSVMVTDGGVEALYTVCRNLCRPGDEFVTTDPGWKWPIHFSQASGAKVIEIPIYDPARNYRLQVEQLAATVTERTRAIYLVDPNNPLGVCYTDAELKAFTDIARKVGAYFIHDTTYRHFADAPALAARHYPERTLTIYSFSKWLGLAGLRVGAIISNPDLIEVMAAAPPNNLGCNVVSQRAAIAGLAIKSRWMNDIGPRQRRNQAVIKAAADKIPGLHIPVYPSQANFLVLEVIEAGITPEALCMAYRERNIMIRQGSYHTPAFGHRFVKISTTVPEEWADALAQALPDMVAKARTIKSVEALF